MHHVAMAHDVCKFGGWLYGPSVPDEIKKTPDYSRAIRLHAALHRRGGLVVHNVNLGELKSARTMMVAVSGGYSEISSQSVAALIDWKSQL
jgi:hypothetical protein